ncbi:MAG: hypothetical protein IME96_05860 [Proteobacteria bacterium]|nr:hypothetical protein [Pseudomonadota bacterium]
MKENTLYMFIDEGGNFDFSPKGTKYFTLTCLTEKRPFPTYDRLREIKIESKGVVSTHLTKWLSRKRNGASLDY